VRPDYYCLIPNLLLSSNKYLDATAGFDAVSQAVESLFSQKSNQESIFFAKRSLKILLDNDNFFAKKNILNSHKMAIGANLSGKAINISKTIAPHALSYSFTTMYGVPHGHAVSLSFNKILKFNFYNQSKAICKYDLKKRYETLFKITKTKNIQELDHYFINFKKKLKLEQNFNKLGINLKRDSRKIFSKVNDQRLKNNPIQLLKTDISLIFEKY
jgi:alcohol dehydrogenase class IV